MPFYSPLVERKRQLRGELLLRRRAISVTDSQTKSAAICQILRELLKSQYPLVQQVCAYWPSSGEPDLRELFSEWLTIGLVVGLPVTRKEGSWMDFRPYAPKQRLVLGEMGIEEPDASHGAWLTYAVPTLMIVPALALDSKGRRLGLGKGFYDRFLDKNPQVQTIGVVFSDFLISEIPTTRHDIAMGRVITDIGVAYP